MLDEFRTKGLTGAARALGCDPFVVVKLLVASGRASDDLRFDAATLEALRVAGQFDPPWWTGVSLPTDTSPLRARCRAAIDLLARRGHVGESRTRLENLLGGLDVEEQRAVTRCLEALEDDGLLDVVSTAIGLMVAIPEGSQERIEQFVAGSLSPSAFQAALEG